MKNDLEKKKNQDLRKISPGLHIVSGNSWDPFTLDLWSRYRRLGIGINMGPRCCHCQKYAAQLTIGGDQVAGNGDGQGSRNTMEMTEFQLPIQKQ